jgi:hypothetical protein
MPQDLFGFVPVYFFGAPVPTYDGAVQSFPNDGIVGSLDDSPQVQLFDPLALDVMNEFFQTSIVRQRTFEHRFRERTAHSDVFVDRLMLEFQDFI